MNIEQEIQRIWQVLKEHKHLGLDLTKPLDSTSVAHASSHEDGGDDEIDVTGLSGLLDDPQTPLTHATSHEAGGSDPIKLDDLEEPDDNTDLDSDIDRHGLLPKLSGSSSDVFRGDGSFGSVPTPSVPWQILGPSDDDSKFLSITSEIDNGDVIYTAIPPADAGGNCVISRYEKSNGILYRTHTVTDASLAVANNANTYLGMAVIGDYLYVFGSTGATVCRRYAKADLTGATSMSWDAAPSGWGGGAMPLFTDGTHLYFGKDVSNTSTFKKYTVSGTDFTFVSEVSYTGISDNISVCWCDGTNVYFCNAVSIGYDGVIYKYPLAGGSATSTTTRHLGIRLQGQHMRGFHYDSSTTFAIAIHGQYDATNFHTHLLTITKP